MEEESVEDLNSELFSLENYSPKEASRSNLQLLSSQFSSLPKPQINEPIGDKIPSVNKTKFGGMSMNKKPKSLQKVPISPVKNINKMGNELKAKTEGISLSPKNKNPNTGTDQEESIHDLRMRGGELLKQASPDINVVEATQNFVNKIKSLEEEFIQGLIQIQNQFNERAERVRKRLENSVEELDQNQKQRKEFKKIVDNFYKNFHSALGLTSHL